MLELAALVLFQPLLAHLLDALVVAAAGLTGLGLEARQLTAAVKATEAALMMGLLALLTQAAAVAVAAVLRA